MFKPGIMNKFFYKTIEKFKFYNQKIFSFSLNSKKNEKLIGRKINSLSKYYSFTKISFLNFL